MWVAGHKGMVGSALVRRLQSENCEILTAAKSELDLRDPAKTRDWIETKKPDAIFLAAARAGGILANDTYPVEFLYDNLMIEANVIEAAYRAKVAKLLFLGSSCIYPKMAPQPIPEDALLTGPPSQPTNGMRWLRLPGSSYARPIESNTEAIHFGNADELIRSWRQLRS